MKNIFCLFCSLLIVLPSSICLGQSEGDSTKFSLRFALYTDMMLNLLNEKNFGAEIKLRQKISVGASYARVMPSYYLGDHIFIASHHKFPPRIFDGFALRAYFKYYLPFKYGFYFQLTAMYKDAGYGYNYVFDGAGDDGSKTTERINERAKIYGAYLLAGQEFEIAKYGFIDMFFGLAYRNRIRTYTTISSKVEDSYFKPDPLGTFTVSQHYFAPVIGLKLGFCYQKKWHKNVNPQFIKK